MKSDVQRDISWSNLLFYNQVWPLVREKLGNGEILQMEGRPDIELATLLDMRAGIDGWHLTTSGGLRGIAARVQKGDRAWNTFTIRKSRDNGSETEFSKRSRAIFDQTGEIYPHLTIQAYSATEEGPILSVGICKTADIMSFILSGNAQTRRTSNAEFYVCDWEDMNAAGIRVGIVTTKQTA